MRFWDLDGFLSHNIWINVKMARRRNAACSDNNLFGFKLGTLKYFMETVTEITPDAAWITPELELSELNKLCPLSPSLLKKQPGVQLPFRHQEKALLRLSSAVLTQLQPPEQGWPAWPSAGA